MERFITLPEVFGNTKDPKKYIKIQYWGSWGYRARCDLVMEALNSRFPNHFQYLLVADTDLTGNFEITLHEDAACSSEGFIVHSYHKSKSFPDANMNALFKLIKN